MRPFYVSTKIDAPFDIRHHRFVLKSDDRIPHPFGRQIAVLKVHGAPTDAVSSVIDGSGLDEFAPDRLIRHSTEEKTMWLFKPETEQTELVFDFWGEPVLGAIAIWNYNKPAYTDYGIAKADISVWTEKGGWKTLLKSAAIGEAEGSSDYGEPTILEFEPVAASKVRLSNLVPLGKSGHLGISEIRFHQPHGPAACNPIPRNQSVIAGGNTVLRWTAGKDAVAHALYMGKSPESLSLLGRFTGPAQAAIEGLDLQTEYFWKIVEIQREGAETDGPTWSLTTGQSVTAHWSFEESHEENSKAVSSTVYGQPLWVDGHQGRAIQLDGANDYIRVDPLNLNTNIATFSCWLHITEESGPYTGIVFYRSGNSASGLNFRTGRTLGYHWKDAENTYSWHSDLDVPLNQWVFAALTIEPTKATLYLWDGNELKTAVNAVNHAPEAFDNPLIIGRDTIESTRYFKGLLDEVRICNYALTQEQIMAICRFATMPPASGPRLVNVNLISDDQSLQDALATVETADAQPASRKNLLAVFVIFSIVIAAVAVTAFKKQAVK